MMSLSSIGFSEETDDCLTTVSDFDEELALFDFAEEDVEDSEELDFAACLDDLAPALCDDAEVGDCAEERDLDRDLELE